MVRARVVSALALAVALSAGLFLGMGQRVHAEDHAVVGNGTPASCTEAAFETALAAGGTITFNCGAAEHTIVLKTYKNVTKDTILDGGNLIVLDGGGVTGILAIKPNITVEVRNIKLQNSNLYAAVENRGTLTLRHVTTAATLKGGVQNPANATLTIVDSTLTGSRFHAALTNGGDATVRNSTFSDNVQYLAGAIDSEGRGRMWIYDSTFTDNKSRQWGGAVFNGSDPGTGGMMVIEGSTFFSNTTDGEGGAIASSGPMTITTSNIYSNTALHSGGIHNANVMVIERTRVTGNRALVLNGGGVGHHNLTQDVDQLTIRSSTIDNNVAARSGGGVYFNSGGDGILTLENVTISGNHSTQTGGGAYIREANATLLNDTLAGNTSDDPDNEGIFVQISNQGSVTLRNTVVAGGSCEGPIQDGGGNFQDNGETCGASKSGNAQLGTLGMHGGLTPTHIFPESSPLHNGGAATCADFDQRGVTRPQHSACDVGAVELGAAPGLASISPQRAGVGSGPLTLDVVGSNFIQGARVLWGDVPLATTYVDSTHLQALLPAVQLMAARSVQVTVELPLDVAADGGKAAGARTFEINYLLLLPAIRR